MTAFRLATFAVAAALPGGLASGQEPLITASVDAERIGLEDQLALTVQLTGGAAGVGEIPVPALENLDLVAGPSLSTQISMINGAVSQSKSLTYVLQPQQKGPARIGPIEIQVDGSPHSTREIRVEVVDGSVKPRRSRRSSPFGDPLGDPFGDPFADLFERRSPRRGPGGEPKVTVRALADRTRTHVGEPVLLTYYVYTQLSITDFGFSDAPQYPGFWAEPLERPKGPTGGEAATLGGDEYRRFPVLQKLLFPARAGELEIPAATFRLGVQTGGFFQGRAVIERTVEPIAIQVDPLPEEPGFTGAVGRFRAAASLDKTELDLGDAATLRFSIDGKGNLKWIEGPPPFEVPGAKLYPPQDASRVDVGPEGMTGTRTWEFVVVPETAGDLEIPPLRFAYFDPQSGRIERTETAPIPLRVSGAAGTTLTAPARAARAERGGPALRAELELPGGLRDVSPRTLGIGLLLALGLHVALWLGPRTLRIRRAGGRAPRRNVKHALSELQRAGRGQMTKEAAAALIEKALHDVFGTASEPEGPEQEIARALIEEVHFIRYAPQLGDYSEQLRDSARRAAELVRR